MTVRSGFGAPPVVLLWDNFEAQTEGALISGKAPTIGAPYQTILVNGGSGNGLTFSNLYSHGGRKSAKVDWATAGDRAIGFGGGMGNFTSAYISYWRYMKYPATTLPATTNHKQWYLFGAGSGNMPQGISFIPQGNQTWGLSNNNGSIAGSGTWSYQNGVGVASWADTINQWNRCSLF